jgi:hypothetical protein
MQQIEEEVEERGQNVEKNAYFLGSIRVYDRKYMCAFVCR